MDKADEIDTNIRLSIEFILDLVARNKLVVNLKEFKDPNGQRIGDAIANKTASNLIVSIFNGDTCMPNIQAMFIVIRDRKGVHLCITDGMQRICTIIRYIMDELTITGTGTILDGTKFSDLPTEIKEIFLKRLVNFHIIHDCMSEYGPDFFRTLNNTSTKMTLGEILNSKYSRFTVVEEAKKLMKDPEVMDFFLNANKKDDKHLHGVAELLFAAGAHYIKTERICSRNLGGGKAEIINKFVEVDEVAMYSDRIKMFMSFIPDVCKKSNTHFSKYMNKKIKADMTMSMHGDYFPAGYEPYARRNAIISAHSSVLFYVTFGLYEVIDHMAKEHVQEIAMNLDTMFGDRYFKERYNTSVNGRKILERLDYTWDTAVQPVLDKYGYRA
jgi:hypothetical protein